MNAAFQQPQPVFVVPQGPTPDALSQAQFNALFGATPGYVQTTAETNAGITPVNFGYAPGVVQRYMTAAQLADWQARTGSVDQTSAWNAALAQRQQHGEAIVFLSGLYKGNFLVTGQYIDVRFEHFAYEDPGSVFGFIANNTSNPIWQIGDGTTLTSSVRMSGGLQIHGQSTAQKGLLFAGCVNVWIDGLVARGCTTYSVNYTASTTRNSSYVFINDYRIDIPSGASSAIAFVTSQPANYPTSYATALYLNNGALFGSTTSGSWGAQINANCTVWVSNSYWTMGDGTGIDFPDAGGTGALVFSDCFIDTLTTNAAALVTCADNNPIQQHIIGTVTLNGKVTINGTTATTALGGYGYGGNRTMMLNPSITGTLDFQDSNASVAKANQTVYAQQPAQIYRSGTNFFIQNAGSGSGGSVIVSGSNLDLINYGGTADTLIKFGVSGVEILTGTGTPSASLPNGSIFLQTDAGAASPLWVRANSAWSQVTLP